jgi:DNA-binding transcriptional LysR family regulator
MNWAAVNFDWNQVRAFLATVEEGSLSAAARALGLTQPTLGRQVSALEEELGVTLFERSGRTLILTPTGEALAEHVRAMGEAATRLSLVASGQSQSVEGRVKVTASEGYAAYVLPEAVERLRETHPGIVLEIVSTNSLSDLRRREADIAVRNADPTDPEMIARRMPDQKGGLYATPGLIEKYGPFLEVRDLANAPFIGFGSDGVYIDALQKRQVPVTAANLVAGSESHLVHWELARRGIGIGVVGNMVGEKDDLVVPVLHDKLSFEFPVWLVAPSELRTSRRVRIVFDVLAEVLGQAKSAVKVSKSA